MLLNQGRNIPSDAGFIQVTDGTGKLRVSYIGLAVDNTNAFFGFQLPAVLTSGGQV